jgi:hypothetical protein
MVFVIVHLLNMDSTCPASARGSAQRPGKAGLSCFRSCPGVLKSDRGTLATRAAADCRRHPTAALGECPQSKMRVLIFAGREAYLVDACAAKSFWISSRSTVTSVGGRKPSAEYQIWEQMLQRCRNPNNRKYSDYGGRGIFVCSRWGDFANFAADMGSRPTSEHELDRIDNDGPYAPENCRWATRREQMNNTRKNVRVTVGGRTLTAAEFAREMNVHPNAVYSRIYRGLPLDKRVEPAAQHFAVLLRVPPRRCRSASAGWGGASSGAVLSLPRSTRPR